MKAKQTSGPQIIKTTVLNSNCGFYNLRTASLFSIHLYYPSLGVFIWFILPVKLSFCGIFSLKYVVKTPPLFLVNEFSDR